MTRYHLEAQEILQDIVFVILYGVVMGLSIAFKHYSGKTVTAWMRDSGE